MNTKPISVKQHAIIDYALVGILLTVPTFLKMNKSARRIYLAEALLLLPYVALTKQPVAVKGVIPLQVHKKVDPFNVAQFAFQSILNPFRKSAKVLAFNLAFTAIAGLTVLCTDWKDQPAPKK